MLDEVDAHESMSVDELRACYESRLATIGRRVRVELTGGDVVEGVATKVDEDARLVVQRDDGAEMAIDVGDVIHLRT